MIGRRQLGALGSAAALMLLSRAAAAETREQLLVDKARIVVEEFLTTPILNNIRVYMQNAYGALIVPGLLRGGFLIGVEHGTGVMVVRDPKSGVWSDPAFFDLWGGSFGLQLGGQSSDVILTFMNQGCDRQAAVREVQARCRRQRRGRHTGCGRRRWHHGPVRRRRLRLRPECGPLWWPGAGRLGGPAATRMEQGVLRPSPLAGPDPAAAGRHRHARCGGVAGSSVQVLITTGAAGGRTEPQLPCAPVRA